MALITASECARRHGVSPARVAQFVAEGRIRLVDGLVDEDQAEELFRAGIAHQHKGAPQAVGNVGTGESYWDAKTRSEQSRAALAELQVHERLRSLVPVAGVRKAVGVVLGRVRDAILSLPDRLAPLVAAESDQRLVHELIAAEASTCLDELASGFDRLVDDAYTDDAGIGRGGGVRGGGRPAAAGSDDQRQPVG